MCVFCSCLFVWLGFLFFVFLFGCFFVCFCGCFEGKGRIFCLLCLFVLFFVCFVFVTVVCLLLLYLSVFTARSLRLCLNSPSAAKHHIPFGACERVLFKWNQFDTYV